MTRNTLLYVLGIVLLVMIGYYLFSSQEYPTYFLAGNQKDIVVKNENNQDIKLCRGSKVELLESNVSLENQSYDKIRYQGEVYYVFASHLVKRKEEVVQEKTLYVRTPATLVAENSSQIVGFLKKGDEVRIVGYDTLQEDGSVLKYQVEKEDQVGYVRSFYLVSTKEEANAHYDEEETYQKHLKMGSSLGGGSASTLDYFPVVKGNFPNNVMPKEVRAFYLQAGVLPNVDDYIDLAEKSNINAFVVDIKDNTVPAYQAEAMKKHSLTNYEHALYTKEQYREVIQKLKSNGFYVIGRITVFKDSYYVVDHPEDAIQNKKLGEPLKHNNSYWPSAYQREVWEFNVELAKESIRDIGFQEIQFDYVRFPDQMKSLETEGIVDYRNEYEESKAEAIQAFVMYAKDEIHDLEAYISVDVFGESAHNYVTAYGQYWPAISNVVDVISGMPYPDHFGKYEYGMKEVGWTNPYELLLRWGSYVEEKQTWIPTPAIVRNWIQAYNTTKEPTVIYDAKKVREEIQALYEKKMTGGYMTWNGHSSISKYREIQDAFRKE